MKQVNNNRTVQPAAHADVFRTSSFCQSGECLSVALCADGSVQVRDTKDDSKQPLSFTRNEWIAFIKGVKNNEFDTE